MPRISARTVAEHTARQEAAVLAAAARLFAERSPSDVTLADIAAEAGLARNSIYRYFPDKAHLVAAWFRAVLAPLHEASLAIAARRASATTRLDAWLDLHLDYLTQPEHQAMVAAAGDLSSLPPDVRADIAEGHRVLYATLQTIVTDALGSGGRRHDPGVITSLLSSMLSGAANLVISGASRATVGRELRSAARGVVAGRNR
jgi:AcrR family transcriptional regulator